MAFAVADISFHFPITRLPTTAHRLKSIAKTLALPAPPLATDLSLHSPATLAALCGFTFAAVVAVSLTDPERRRYQQAREIGGTDKEVVREYFNGTGFDRWRRIYGEESEGVSKIQHDIRSGHSKTVENAILMLKSSGPLSGVTVCDAGCGTGSFAIPLAREGAIVHGSDISEAMVSEARRRAEVAISVGFEGTMPEFEVRDLEGLEGKYDAVACLDVLIHYPPKKAEGMIVHLASLAEKRLLLSFAPKTVYYSLLKRVGEIFPGASKATRAYLHDKREVGLALEKAGWRVRRRMLISTRFYFAELVEAVPAA